MADSPDRNQYDSLTHRTRLALGDAAVTALSRARMIVVGLGGVGSWCAEALARSGVLDLTLVDPDTVCATNVNRQAQATALNTGEPKAIEMEKRLLAISPTASITPITGSYREETRAHFDLASYDCVIDAIDSIDDKLLLIRDCLRAETAIFSSMGAAMKTDPGRIRAGLLTQATGCPLARLVRKGLRRDGVGTDIMCVYSDEPPLQSPAPDHGGRREMGSLVHITAVFGFTLASLAVNYIAAGRSGRRS